MKNRSLLAVDFKAGQLPAGAKGDKGDTGATGAAGATGATGAKGDPGATNVIVRERVVANIGAGASQDETIQCAAGEKAIAGGGGMSVLGSRSFGNNHIETSVWISTPVDRAGSAGGRSGPPAGPRTPHLGRAPAGPSWSAVVGGGNLAGLSCWGEPVR